MKDPQTKSTLDELKELANKLSDRDVSIKRALKEIEKIVSGCDCRYDGSECKIKEIIASIKWTEHKTDGTSTLNS